MPIRRVDSLQLFFEKRYKHSETGYRRSIFCALRGIFVRGTKRRIFFVNRKNRFSDFPILTWCSNGEPGGCNGRQLQKKVDRKFLHVNTINFHYYDLACNSLWGHPEPLAYRLFSIIFSIMGSIFSFFCTTAHERGTPRTRKTSATASLGVL